MKQFPTLPLAKALEGTTPQEWFEVLDETIRYMALTCNDTALQEEDKQRLLYRLYTLRDAFAEVAEHEK